MSIPFSDVDNLNGILQLIEKELEFDYGDITGNTTRLKEWTAEVNLTDDLVQARIFTNGGLWQHDDSNHVDYPIIKRNLESGKRDYTFTTDEQGNVIVGIHRVLVAGPDGVFREVAYVDQQSRNNSKVNTTSFIDGQDETGTPTEYDKTANGIFLDLIPDYNLTGGLKVFIDRESTRFTITDTTKKPGIDGLAHEYYVVHPAYKYASRKGLKVANGLLQRKIELEAVIDDRYGHREKDAKKTVVPFVESAE